MSSTLTTRPVPKGRRARTNIILKQSVPKIITKQEARKPNNKNVRIIDPLVLSASATHHFTPPQPPPRPRRRKQLMPPESMDPTETTTLHFTPQAPPSRRRRKQSLQSPAKSVPSSCGYSIKYPPILPRPKYAIIKPTIISPDFDDRDMNKEEEKC